MVEVEKWSNRFVILHLRGGAMASGLLPPPTKVGQETVALVARPPGHGDLIVAIEDIVAIELMPIDGEPL